jgi:hypothetical protein
MQPFNDGPLVALAADARSFFVLDRKAADDPKRGEFTIRKLDLAGRQMWQRRYSYVPQKMSDQLVDAVIANDVKSLVEGPGPAKLPEGAARAAVRKGLYLPKHFPPIEAVVAGKDGTLWLKREDLRKQFVSWMLVGPSGEMIATVDLPRRLRVMYADRTQVIGEELDEFDVPHISRYRIKALRK